MVGLYCYTWYLAASLAFAYYVYFSLVLGFEVVVCRPTVFQLPFFACYLSLLVIIYRLSGLFIIFRFRFGLILAYRFPFLSLLYSIVLSFSFFVFRLLLFLASVFFRFSFRVSRLSCDVPCQVELLHRSRDCPVGSWGASSRVGRSVDAGPYAIPPQVCVGAGRSVGLMQCNAM